MKLRLPPLAALVLASSALGQSSLVVPAGSTFVYDTSSGPLVLTDLTIEAGGTLRALGPRAFRVRATGSLRIDGRLELSAFDSPGVQTLNTTNISEPGSAGGPGGGRGGTGNPLTTQSSPSGTNGHGPVVGPREGGGGGESGISSASLGTDERRPGGGAGGALAADQPVHPDPLNPLNLGLIAGRGANGWPTALGVRALTPPPRGGALGQRAFVDADPTNDFFGFRLLSTGVIQVGELQSVVGGSGGGGGGNAINGLVWPPPVFNPTADEKGAGGGGGGGVGILLAYQITLGPLGRIHADGGDGGGGENTIFLNRVGGGSGGGSGGYLVLQARNVDLSAASDRALTALGGRGGPGKDNAFGAVNAGGNGGPGVIAIHVPPSVGGPILPTGKTLSDLSAPTALVLLPDSRF
jgi:hypothetical protein